MHVAFIELLRCPRAHAESALVATADKRIERRIVEGTLGCPVCAATFPVWGGIADMRENHAVEEFDAASQGVPNEAAVLRLAAQLDLTEGGRLVLLCGEYGRLAPPLSVTYDAQILALNPPTGEERHIAQHASVLRIESGVPLASGSIQGVATDAVQSADLGLTNFARVLRPNGRLVAPCDVPQPAEVEVLAQDDREWVAKKVSTVVKLQRGGALGR
jgi:uncharacterized protein YbaR (Trm112 family)